MFEDQYNRDLVMPFFVWGRDAAVALDAVARASSRAERAWLRRTLRADD